MTEAIIETDKRSKRRLPSWMQSNGNQTETEGVVSVIESMSSQAEKIKNSENKEIFAKIYSEKNGSQPKKSDCSKDYRPNTAGTKRRSEWELFEPGESIDTQHVKLRSSQSNSEKVLSQGSMEDAAELTVEDLISFAEEFLTTDKEIQNEQLVARKCESDFILMRPSKSSTPRRQKLNKELMSFQVLSKCAQTQSLPPSNLVHNKKIEESAANKIIQSGDAAQDMLELLLGPLLKKASLKEPDPEIARELLTSTYESDSPVGSFVGVEKQALLMKKKSSLKDKVAIFFD